MTKRTPCFPKWDGRTAGKPLHLHTCKRSRGHTERVPVFTDCNCFLKWIDFSAMCWHNTEDIQTFTVLSPNKPFFNYPTIRYFTKMKYTFSYIHLLTIIAGNFHLLRKVLNTSQPAYNKRHRGWLQWDDIYVCVSAQVPMLLPSFYRQCGLKTKLLIKISINIFT